MNLKYYLLISLAINIVLAYIILKPDYKSSQFENILLERIKAEHKASEARILSDSIATRGSY
jgi:hypothetical protein